MKNSINILSDDVEIRIKYHTSEWFFTKTSESIKVLEIWGNEKQKLKGSI